jgi:DNA-binding response OmpR family regulator
MAGEEKRSARPPRILLIESQEDCHSSGPGFHEILAELADGSFELDPYTWTDGLMKTFPSDYQAALMDCGRLGGYEFDVIRKIHGEMGIPILLHSTEDRPPVINEVKKQGATEFLRKPFGMGNLVGRITAILAPGSSTDSTGENG